MKGCLGKFWKQKSGVVTVRKVVLDRKIDLLENCSNIPAIFFFAILYDVNHEWLSGSLHIDRLPKSKSKCNKHKREYRIPHKPQ